MDTQQKKNSIIEPIIKCLTIIINSIVDQIKTNIVIGIDSIIGALWTEIIKSVVKDCDIVPSYINASILILINCLIHSKIKIG